MTTAEMLVVAVPTGAVTGTLARLRVLFVPRLQADAPGILADFGLEDWPKLLAEATFTAETASDPEAPAPLAVTASATRGDSLTWQAFFAPTMPVDPWQAQSYPAPHADKTAEKANRVAANYSASAQAYADPDTDTATVVHAQYEGWTDPEPAGPDSGMAPGSWETPDFHRSVSMLREHSTVLMELGLIVELTLDTAGLPSSPANGAPQLIRVLCTAGAGAPAVTFTPTWTQYSYDSAYFLPFAPDEDDIQQGMLDLSTAKSANAANEADTKWVIATFDVDGGAGRLRDAARSGGASANLADGVSLPVLHSVGPTVIRTGRGEQLRRRAARGQNNMVADARDLQLDADHLILGYRVDVQLYGDDTWSSLCERTATYTVGGRTIGVSGAIEEGHVKANAAAVGRDRVFRANEVVVRWSGWSLARPRPILDENGPVASDAARVPMPFDFSWRHQAAGTLPQLRFGNAYLMRIRIADVAGGGLLAQEVDGSRCATSTIAYRRHEPIAPPELAPPPDLVASSPPPTDNHASTINPFGPGGALDCLVVRSDPATGSDAAKFAADNPGLVHNDRRWLLPPPMSFALAEQHGVLDGAEDATWPLARRAMAAPQAASDGSYNWLPDVAALGIAAHIRANPDAVGSNASTSLKWGTWPDLPAKRLQLGPPEAGQPIISWTQDETGAFLKVRLAPAAEIEVELSSFLNSNDLDKHEITSWLGQPPGPAVIEGRHPMVTPPHVLRFVHAVRKPLKKPAGMLIATRPPGQTSVTLAPAPDAKLGLDIASTGQVDVTASWRDMVDYPAYAFDGIAPDAPLPEPTLRTDTLPSLRIDRGISALPMLNHELGDTTHRTISYTATAISRFGSYFDDEPGDAFTQTSAPILTLIPNAARPLPPVILAAVPAYRWEVVDPAAVLPGGGICRRRLGNRLRIELARPWHKSGEGEQLAVILAPAGGATDDRRSQIFRDPIWQTDLPPARLDPTMFAGMSSPAISLMLGSDSSSVQSEPVVAVPFAVSYDRDSGRWHADIAVPAAAAGYAPFIRLALARYQPGSLQGLELSPSVLTDFLPLAPDRTLTIVPSGDGVDVTLEGVTPVGPQSNELIIVAEEASLSADSDLTSLQSSAALWTRIGGAVAVGSLGQPVHLPLAAAPEGRSRRLVVREVEQIDLPFGHPIDDLFLSELHQRTVFLDVVPL